MQIRFTSLHFFRNLTSRVVAKQYSNGLFGLFDTFELSKQTLLLESSKRISRSVYSTF
jgi:hypothetical protein